MNNHFAAEGKEVTDEVDQYLHVLWLTLTARAAGKERAEADGMAMMDSIWELLTGAQVQEARALTPRIAKLHRAVRPKTP